MDRQKIYFRVLIICIMLATVKVVAQPAGKWIVPSGGNSYLVDILARDGDEKALWRTSDQRYLLFFRTDRPCVMDLSLNMAIEEGSSRLEVSIGTRVFKVKASGKEFHPVKIGKVRLEAGYHKIELRGKSKTGSSFGTVKELILQYPVFIFTHQ